MIHKLDDDDSLEEINPTDLNNKKLNLQNMVDNTWSEFLLTVEELDKTSFLSSLVDNSKEFAVGIQGHLLYIEHIENDGKTLACINSYGGDDQFQDMVARFDGLNLHRAGEI